MSIWKRTKTAEKESVDSKPVKSSAVDRLTDNQLEIRKLKSTLKTIDVAILDQVGPFGVEVYGSEKLLGIMRRSLTEEKLKEFLKKQFQVYIKDRLKTLYSEQDNIKQEIRKGG